MTDLRDNIAAVIANCDMHKDTFRDIADAIIAALPDMVAPLVWVKTTGFWRASDCRDGFYEVFALSGGRSTGHHIVRGQGTNIGDGTSMASDIAAANAHHAAAVVAAFTGVR